MKLYVHLPNFNIVCALSDLVSLFIKFDVCSKHALTSFYLMFTGHTQQTKKKLLRLTASKLRYFVDKHDKCNDLVLPLDLEKLSHAV